MPKNDKDEPSSRVVAQTTDDGYGRIPIPKDIADRISWLDGTEKAAWLLLVAEGRYRLLSDDDVDGDPQLQSVRMFLEHGPEQRSEPLRARSNKDAALLARLFRTTIKQHKGMWRVAIPKMLRDFQPADCDAAHFTLLLSAEGYWDIWYRDIFRRSASVPWSQS